MKNKYIIFTLIVLISSSICSATSLVYVHFSDSWKDADIIVWASPLLKSKTVSDDKTKDILIYALDIEKTYKEKVSISQVLIKRYKPKPVRDADGSFSFSITMGISSDIIEGQKYIYFVKKNDESFQVIRSFNLDNNKLIELEEAINISEQLHSVKEHEKKDFLINALNKDNSYVYPKLRNEVCKHKYKEAIPFFQRKLKNATNDSTKLGLLGNLELLGHPGYQKQLLIWLADNSFKEKKRIISLLGHQQDSSLIPVVKEFVTNTDELLAVEACSTILRLGDPDGMPLLFDILKNSLNSTVRYNALYSIKNSTSLPFISAQKKDLIELYKDKDEYISRLAKSINTRRGEKIKINLNSTY